MASGRERKWSSGSGGAAVAAGAPRHGAAYGRPFGETERRDLWWLQPLVQAAALLVLGAYATWAAFQGVHYEFGNYLSPFYSPLLKPKWWPLSPALLVLGAPLGFRGTCYYYRKAYYRAFFADPTGVRGRRAAGSGYSRRGELPVRAPEHPPLPHLPRDPAAVLPVDATSCAAFSFDGHFGIGVGSLVILASNALLTAVHVLLPLDAPPGRRAARLLLVRRGRRAAAQGLARRRAG